ncbi:unnamed protein product [Ophioblennius macclurei]
MAAVDSFQLLHAEICRFCSGYYEVLALLGAAYAASKAVVLLRDCWTLVRVHFLPRMVPRCELGQRFGKWAVVYGVSEPIARAYAEELARNGISIILIAQNHTSVQDVAASFSQNYGVETVIVSANFSLDQAAGKPFKEAIRGRDVGFLVSSMDESSVPTRQLAEAPEQDLLDMLNQNVAGATLMARWVLPGMVERGRGAVVNISPAGRLAGRVTLAASAGYMERLSRALQVDYGSKGIFVQSLTPLEISHSKHQQQRWWRESWLVPKPEVYARHALSTLGLANRTTGYWPHTLQYALMRRIPDWIWVLVWPVYSLS